MIQIATAPNSRISAANTATGKYRGRVVACALLLTLCSAYTAYYRAFVSMANYDDEGYMMWTVAKFLSGQALYDQVATVYGPFYYLYEWCALSLARVGAASDSLRLVSAAFWVAAALIAFVLVYRATGSLLLAVCVHLLAFRAWVSSVRSRHTPRKPASFCCSRWVAPSISPTVRCA